MRQVSSEKNRSTVATVVGAAARLPKAMRGPLRGANVRAYLRAYYANVDAEDLAGRQPSELAVMASSHLKLARRRRGRAMVRVFNPSLRDDGYTSAHTVIEMVNDDMPFLVDSIGLALTQRSLTLHFLAHPVFAVTRDAAGNLQSVRERGQADDGKKQR